MNSFRYCPKVTYRLHIEVSRLLAVCLHRHENSAKPRTPRVISDQAPSLLRNVPHAREESYNYKTISKEFSQTARRKHRNVISIARDSRYIEKCFTEVA
ncbi:hypothetical protein RRG08_001511 [Elysia crispata]|uniref:Uncharacterized protein n=1 Tax=Elysia crispata TaxID=231223 RepID=A0AAE1AAV8_9GAST|nr:hypothetical protein RRG08_001511 [Elysia crispata]